MPTDENDSYLELFDVAKKAQLGKRLLSQIRFIPRIGERIFFPVHGSGDWIAYTVVSVEYFLRYNPSTEQPPSSNEGMGRITLYLEESK